MGAKSPLAQLGADTEFAAEAINLYEAQPREPPEVRPEVEPRAEPKPEASPSSPTAAPLSLAAAETLGQLLAAIKAFEGCALKATAHNTVFARGADAPLAFFIGEAPGADEDRLGEPFVGKSGKLLDEMLAAAEIGMDKARIGNILPWRPPGNRTPTPEEVALCLPFIERHIELARPKLVVFLGGVAAHALLGTEEAISRLRRRWHTYETPNMASPIAAKPTFHPSYLLRAPGQKRLAWQDFLEIAAKLDELTK